MLSLKGRKKTPRKPGNIFSVELYPGSLWLSSSFSSLNTDTVFKLLEEADRRHADDSFSGFKRLSP